MNLSDFGKWLALLGGSILLVGIALWLLGKTGLPIGRLPGDIHIRKEEGSFHFPIVTCLLVSVVLTILLSIVLRLFR